MKTLHSLLIAHASKAITESTAMMGEVMQSEASSSFPGSTNAHERLWERGRGAALEPSDLPLPGRFGVWVGLQPDAVAVDGLSYREVGARSDRLA
ncbi:hypothetical protein, partial [Streptomyces chattanoogensis]|uniref:hypothetical protein n=1 Tax=Streptomyces chattanoogensis TaxID=66876 RepID=UPI001B7FFF77